MSILIKGKITQKCRKIYNLYNFIFAYSFLRLLFVICLILFSLSYYLVLNHVTIFIAFDCLTVNFSLLALIFFFCKHCLASNSLAHFCDPVIQQFFCCLWIVTCWKIVVCCNWSRLPENCELLQSLIVNREYTYIEEIKSLLINSLFFFFGFFFSSQQGQAQSKRHPIKNKTKNVSISLIQSNFS